MEYEIIETPIWFHLHGLASAVAGNCYGDVGMRLMNQMWQIVKESRTATSGINHWVYLPDDRMYVGVELVEGSSAPSQLEPLDFELQRYLKHLHMGPYNELPGKWKALKTELASLDEAIGSPSLEVYGHHHCDDPSKLETTILIGLARKNA